MLRLVRVIVEHVYHQLASVSSAAPQPLGPASPHRWRTTTDTVTSAKMLLRGSPAPVPQPIVRERDRLAAGSEYTGTRHANFAVACRADERQNDAARRRESAAARASNEAKPRTLRRGGEHAGRAASLPSIRFG